MRKNKKLQFFGIKKTNRERFAYDKQFALIGIHLRRRLLLQNDLLNYLIFAITHIKISRVINGQS
jgi:hypothetical protein